MPKHLDTDSLTTLINALSQYREDLSGNRTLIAEAADACDAVMGGDALSQKYVSRIDEVLAQIDATAVIAEQIQASLSEELRRAVDLYES